MKMEDKRDQYDELPEDELGPDEEDLGPGMGGFDQNPEQVQERIQEAKLNILAREEEEDEKDAKKEMASKNYSIIQSI